MEQACERTIKYPLASPSFTQPEDPIFSCYYGKTSQFYPCKILNARIALLISSYQAAAFSLNIHISKKIISARMQSCDTGFSERSMKHHPSQGESKRRLKELSLISMPKYAHSRSISTDEQLFLSEVFTSRLQRH